MRTDDTEDLTGRSARVEAAFAAEVLRSRQLASRALSPVFVLVLAWVTFENGFPGALFFYPLIAALWALLLGPYLLIRRGIYRPWHDYVFILLLVTIFTVMVLVPNPLGRIGLPPQVHLGQGNDMYLVLIIIGTVFTYSPRIVAWTGLVATLVWSAATLWILMQPESIGDIPNDVWAAMSNTERIYALADPYKVNLGKWGRQVIVYGVGAAVLAGFVSRSRQLVYSQAATERERANLSRYFSPNMVDQLAQSDEPLRVTKSQEIAVLFADLVGFTTLSERRPPEEVILLLRGFHGRMQQAVFDCSGTLDKYIGDAVMATFGTPTRGPNDASNALRCARTMLAAIEEWNAERAAGNESPVRVGIGVHYGPVVMGDIGGEQRLEFAVIGDAVNVASRLERLTRDLGASVVVSADVVDAARREGGEAEKVVAGFVEAEPQAIRGREGTVRVFKC